MSYEVVGVRVTNCAIQRGIISSLGEEGIGKAKVVLAHLCIYLNFCFKGTETIFICT